MNRKPFEGKPFQNPDFNSIWAEHFPKVARYGILGAVAVSALVWAHNRFSNSTTEIEPPQDQTDTHDPEA